MEQDKIISKLAKIFDLPQDVVLNLPVIYLTGSLSLVLENHQGVHKYTTEEIKIKVTEGFIVIEGSDLKLDYLSENKIAVIGQIEELIFASD